MTTVQNSRRLSIRKILAKNIWKALTHRNTDQFLVITWHVSVVTLVEGQNTKQSCNEKKTSMGRTNLGRIDLCIVLKHCLIKRTKESRLG